MINPYRNLDDKDFSKMGIKKGFMVVKAVMPDEVTELRIELAESSKDYNQALLHKIVRMGEGCFDGEEAPPRVGYMCMVVGNTLDAVDKGRFCFVDSRDVYCWWPL